MNWFLFTKRTLIVVLCFLSYKYSKYIYGYLIFGTEKWEKFSLESKLSLMLFIALILACLAKYLLTKKVQLKDFGLDPKDLPKGLLIASICVIPQLIGLGFYSNWEFEISSRTIYRDLVLAGFGEEFIFRAFLFGLLFFYAGWGFLSAGILPAYFLVGYIYIKL